MTFGKHEGQRLEDIPRGYLRWLLSAIQERDIDPRLREGIVRRIYGKPSGPDLPSPYPDYDLANRIVGG